MIRALVENNRSFRRFVEGEPLSEETLRDLIDLARLSATGANNQPLKFLISNDAARNATIFPHLAWAGYLKNWDGPGEGERPSAYVVVLLDTEISDDAGCDHGIAAQSILLGAVEKGFGGCMIGSVKRERLAEALKLSERYKVLLVIALGKPAEEVVVETASESIEYWRDDNGVHHVPKRPLDELIL